MTFNAEALAGKSKQAQIVKAFKFRELGSFWWINLDTSIRKN